MLTTVLQNGIWVTETSRSFHYWQRTPIWKLLPGLVNPGNPAMSPTQKGRRALVTLITQWKEREGRGEQPLRSVSILKKCSLHKPTLVREQMDSWRMCVFKYSWLQRVLWRSLLNISIFSISLSPLLQKKKKKFTAPFLLSLPSNLISKFHSPKSFTPSSQLITLSFIHGPQESALTGPDWPSSLCCRLVFFSKRLLSQCLSQSRSING